METTIDIIKDFKGIFRDALPEGPLHLWISTISNHSIINKDESRVDILSVQFNDYPMWDEDEQALWTNALSTFEKYFIETVQKVHQIELQALNNNGHYFCNNHGNTISVHFNDESLIYIETYTGQ